MLKEQKTYELWANSLTDFREYTEELNSIKNNEDEIIDRFYRDLSFGTAGLRGILGLGTNRMNFFTVGRATQGLANYLLTKKDNPVVAIGYDSRNFSKEFAEHAASIFAANNCTVHLFPKLVPTPVLAYATVQLSCDCGVVITASHNPAKYNGYKVFNSVGCQIDDDIASSVEAQIGKIDIFKGVKKLSLQEGLNTGSIKYINESLELAYLDQIYKEALQPEICKKAGLKIVYTPLNGTGNFFVRAMLKKLGIENVSVVKEQELPDGNFPTCPYPNPEFKEALELGLKLAKETNSDVLLATDPDADRAAIAVLYNGEYHILTGNHLGVLLLDYISKTRKALNKMPANPVTVRSIVSTKLVDEVAADYGVELRDVLTGFKFIGEVIGELDEKGEKDRFIFGFEEACGFLIGTHVRDKDAVVTSTLIAEMLSFYKMENINIMDVLDNIYKKHHYYSNMAQNLVFEGAEGMDKMTSIMSGLRNNPPREIVGRKIVSYLDYLTSVRMDGQQESKLNTRPSNVLEYRLDDGCSVIIRPSGTEPKLKLYYSLIGKTKEEVEALEKEYAPASVELAGIEV